MTDLKPGPVGETPLPPHLTGCFGCGPANPAGLGVAMALSGDHVRARVVVGDRHAGAPGRIHGGIVATIMDETLGTVPGRVLGRPAVTGTLTLRYERPAPVGVELLADAWLVADDGRKLTLGGTLSAGGDVLARADAVFLTMPTTHFRGGPVPVPQAPSPPEPGEVVLASSHPGCFACDRADGLGLRHLRAGDELVSRFVPTPAFDGTPGVVHGGALAAAFDDAMGTAPIVLTSEIALTGTLAVRYERFAVSGRELTVRTRLTGRDGRRLHVAAEMHDAGGRLATATATFVVPAPAR